MAETSNLVSLDILLAWPALVGLLFLVDLRHGRMPLFLSYAYIAGLAILHLPGGFAHALPWKPFHDSTNTITGMSYTTLALASFVFGTAIMASPTRAMGSSILDRRLLNASSIEIGYRCAQTLLVAGLLAWVIEITPLMRVPSVPSIISAGKQLLIGGICLMCWLAWKTGATARFYFWLATSVLFPAYSLVESGFLSYGITFLLTVLIFVGTFYRPRVLLVAVAAVSIYAGLSLFVGYLENRKEIRRVVWGEHSLESRIDVVGSMLSQVEPFDPLNNSHLVALDERLNQNDLVGAAVHYVPNLKEYADGQTIYYAVIALIPRAIWPDKPIVAGSMGMVGDYTGRVYPPGTSVGMGQVMEFYINFGTTGVLVGFFLLGMAIRFVDFKIAENLALSNWRHFALWFLIGTAMLQPISQLLEITASMAAAAVLGLGVSRYLDLRAASQVREQSRTRHRQGRA